MTFNKTPPTKPGAYLYHHGDDVAAALVYKTDNDRLIAELSDAYCGCVSEMEGEWCALVPAEEVEKAFSEGYEQGKLNTFSLAAWRDSRARRVAGLEEV